LASTLKLALEKQTQVHSETQKSAKSNLEEAVGQVLFLCLVASTQLVLC